MGLDIDRLIGYGDDFGMQFPRRMYKIEFNKWKKRGKLPKHPHKAFRSAFKNANVKHPPYIKDWDDDGQMEDDVDWFYDEGEAGAYDLPDYSYADYKPTFGLRDELGGGGEGEERVEHLDNEGDEWRAVVDQVTQGKEDASRNPADADVNSKPNNSWFTSLFRNIF